MVYLRITDTSGAIQVALVTSKTKVAPVVRLTIPRLELCGTYILAQLLHHIIHTIGLQWTQSYAWTDSTIVLSWLTGSPRRFKLYVGNRISSIVYSSGLLRTGGSRAGDSDDRCYPIILSGKHPVIKLIFQSEQVCLLHAGPNLLTCSLSQKCLAKYQSNQCHQILSSTMWGLTMKDHSNEIWICA